MTIRERLDEISEKRVLILDGAMGTMIQRFKLTEEDYRGKRFENHTHKVAGCNDLLCLTKPDIISGIHDEYLKSGADIIETCSFNANAVTLADYGLAEAAYEISKVSAALARKAADAHNSTEKPRFVAGILGPTTKSASISPDMNDPAKRSICWDELEKAYYDNARGLMDGGADILMVETIFDTLNTKAAIAAILSLQEERGIDIPLMISAAISDAAGRLLAGQTVEAFYISVRHANPWSVGLNCSLGADLFFPHIKALSGIADCRISAHPNAGLPDEQGVYRETPEKMAHNLKQYIENGLVNVVGGCCGSTPAHIAEIAAMTKGAQPRKKPDNSKRTWLSGLEPLEIRHGAGLTIVGERGNAPGSKVFLDLIKAGKFEDGLRLVRKNIEDGAKIVDICMDDGLIDGKSAIVRFVNLALSNPDIARVPFVVDSSRFEVIEAALKCIAGRAIANSISLKEGEAEFIGKARRLKMLGAAVMVMLFDEQGQAATYTRKVQIAERSYTLLKNFGFPPEDIFIDPNILAIATGMSEHDAYALDFISAIPEILKRCPGVHISAGVSNLSFSFRGNWNVRNAIHSVFLKLAEEAGLSVAIVNIAALGLYEKLEENFSETITDLLLCRNKEAAEKILKIAEQGLSFSKSEEQPKNENVKLPVRERILNAMIKGNDDNIEADVLEMAENSTSTLSILEGPLMEGMSRVGFLFGEGRMFLPQVIRSARVMKKAVAVLSPYLAADTSQNNALTKDDKKIVMATVRGDVHDIGKTIVGTVLACNGFKIIDLGVMVPHEKIIETAVQEHAALIGLSGLVTPSLDEMINVAEQMEKLGLKIPLLIGGAAASLAHTALKIAPVYNAPVVYISDAGKAPGIVRALLSESLRAGFLENLDTEYTEAVIRHEKIVQHRRLLSYKDARRNRPIVDFKKILAVKPKITSPVLLNDYDIETITPFIHWNSLQKKLFSHEALKGKGTDEAEQVLVDAKTLLKKVIKEKLLTLRGIVNIFFVKSKDDDILIFDDCKNTAKEIARLSFLRNQEQKQSGSPNACLSDFISAEGDWLGFFAISAGFGLEESKKMFVKNNDDYGAVLISLLSDSLVEAFSEEIHYRVRNEWWAYEPCEKQVEQIMRGNYQGIRPAFGYPCCPDHNDKRIVFKLLDVEKTTGLSLTETSMIKPVSSLCGMYFANPLSYYFSAGAIGQDQLEDWAKRKNIGIEEARKRAAFL